MSIKEEQRVSLEELKAAHALLMGGDDSFEPGDTVFDLWDQLCSAKLAADGMMHPRTGRMIIDHEWGDADEPTRNAIVKILNALPQLTAAVAEHDQLRAENDAKDKRIAELEKQLEWQPIETAPVDGTDVLGWDTNEWPVVVSFEDGRWTDNDYHFVRITHWKPIFTPTKAKLTKGDTAE